jgi:hypothetical protein
MRKLRRKKRRIVMSHNWVRPLPLSFPLPLFSNFGLIGNKDEITHDFRKLVNMTGDEIHKWLQTKESKVVGWKGEDGHDKCIPLSPFSPLPSLSLPLPFPFFSLFLSLLFCPR